MRVTLYTKQDCSLCQEAEALLRRIQRKNRFHLDFVDIEADDALHALYWARISVITVDGEEITAAPIDELLLEARLT